MLDDLALGGVCQTDAAPTMAAIFEIGHDLVKNFNSNLKSMSNCCLDKVDWVVVRAFHSRLQRLSQLLMYINLCTCISHTHCFPMAQIDHSILGHLLLCKPVLEGINLPLGKPIQQHWVIRAWKMLVCLVGEYKQVLPLPCQPMLESMYRNS